MTTTPSSPQQMIHSVLSLMDGNLNSAFANNLSSLLQQSGVETQLWKPSIHLRENASNLYLYVTIPGVNPESLDIDFINNSVIIKGSREFPDIDATDVIDRRREIVYGDFERKILLPMFVSQKESVTIELKNGMLIININKVNENRNHFNLNSNDFQ